MTNFSDWMAHNAQSPMDDSRYAIRAWNLIQRKPVSITILRGSTTLTAQTVRVEYSNSERQAEGESSAKSYKRDVIIFGVKGHPDEDIDDTDIQKMDIFDYDGQTLIVMDVVKVVGGVQAHCEAYS